MNELKIIVHKQFSSLKLFKDITYNCSDMLFFFRYKNKEYTHWGVIKGRTADGDGGESRRLRASGLHVADAVCRGSVDIECWAR